MDFTDNFFRIALDSLPEQLAIIDSEGEIVFVNQSWQQFCEDNQGGGHCWQGDNYLTVCERSAAQGDEDAANVAKGLREVLAGNVPGFVFEYPCHGPNNKRWFMMRVTTITTEQGRFVVIAHLNITERKQAENKLAWLATLDPLTHAANRRRFDEFFQTQWKEHMRRQRPLSLALVDIDHFKLVNDCFGHQSGDKCLTTVAEIMQTHARRPWDLCARLGGDEFALLLGETRLKTALEIADDVLRSIREIALPEDDSEEAPKQVTVSIGIATTTPGVGSEMLDLYSVADSMLYRAKSEGRNRISSQAVESKPKI